MSIDEFPIFPFLVNHKCTQHGSVWPPLELGKSNTLLDFSCTKEISFCCLVPIFRENAQRKLMICEQEQFKIFASVMFLCSN